MDDVPALAWLLADPQRCGPGIPLRAGPGLPRPVLEAMRTEGLVVGVAGGVYLPADAVAWQASRADALRLVVPPGALVGMLAAAWVHGATATPPDVVDVLVPGHAAPPWRWADGVRELERTVPPEEVVRVGGLRLTDLARTAADVARALPGKDARPAVAALLGAGADGEQVLAILARERRHPHAARGRASVRAVLAA